MFQSQRYSLSVRLFLLFLLCVTLCLNSVSVKANDNFNGFVDGFISHNKVEFKHVDGSYSYVVLKNIDTNASTKYVGFFSRTRINVNFINQSTGYVTGSNVELYRYTNNRITNEYHSNLNFWLESRLWTVVYSKDITSNTGYGSRLSKGESIWTQKETDLSPLVNQIQDSTNKQIQADNARNEENKGWLFQAITNALKPVTNAITNIVVKISDFFRTLFIPYQSDLTTILNRFNNFFVSKLGALAQIFNYFTSFLTAITTSAKTFVVDLPPIHFNGIKLLDIDYDLSTLTTNYKTLYDIYYMFTSAGLLTAFFGFLANEYENFFKE